MQQPFMFIDFGSGWKPVNSHTGSVAALASFTIRWGASEIGKQPDPSVLSFSLRDRAGVIAGRAATLAGSRVLVQISGQPTWDDMWGVATWRTMKVPLGDLHQTYSPPLPDDPASSATTIFDGIISTGGDAKPGDNSSWAISLSATSRMVLWKRMQAQGPTALLPKYAGLHWVGTPSERLAELNRRARTSGAPEVDTAGLTLPPNVAPYASDSYPSQLDLLRRLFATSPSMPLWCEYPDRASSHIGYMPLASQVVIGAATDGGLYTLDKLGIKRAMLTGGMIRGDGALTIPAPTTQVSINGRSVSTSEGKLSFSDADTDLGDLGRLPTQLKVTQSSLTLESDVISDDQSGGLWTDGHPWSPSQQDREHAADWLFAINMRLVPKSVSVDSRHIDPAKRPELYISAPSGAFVIARTAFSRLTCDDGRPAASGAWTTIGGTIRFSWHGDEPVLEHDLTLAPLPPDTTRHTVWADMGAWPVAWDTASMTLAELSTITTFDQPTKQRRQL